MLEEMGGCTTQEPENPETTSKMIFESFSKPNFQHESQSILNDDREVGSGTGFAGHELFTKDELNIILDLEDENQRLG
jgi:hypothetical protein